MEKKTDIKYRTYFFAIKIIKFIDKLDKKDYTVQIIIKQLVRCATSIGANIVEAQAGSSTKDFLNFYSYSLKSANETKFWLALLRDTKKCNKEKCNKILNEVKEIANIIAVIIIKIKNNKTNN